MKQFIFLIAGVVIGFLICYFIPLRRSNEIKTFETTINKRTLGIGNIVSTVEAQRYVANYQTDPLNDAVTNPRVTYSILFDTAVFRFIGHYLDTTQSDIKFIKVINLQYNQMLGAGTVNGQRNEYQQSILIAPTKADKTIDWEAWKESSVLFKKLFRPVGAYNHGELCPDVCR